MHARSTGTLRPTTGVLLAAGAGTRLGMGPKAFLDAGGRPLASRLAGELLAGGCSDIVVVLGAGAEEGALQDLAPEGRIVINRAWRDGLSTSFRAGADVVPDGGDGLFALVDQPGLDRRIVARLLAVRPSHPTGVIAAAYPAPGGIRRGHPLLMDAATARQAAAAATADSGARRWLSRHEEQVRLVPCGDVDDGADIDTRDDLLRWMRTHGTVLTGKAGQESH